MPPKTAAAITGILLAAGSSRRFGADKLTQALPDGEWVAMKAFRNLAAAVGQVIVVTRPGSPLRAPLQDLGAEVVEFPGADEGMGASLACGIAATPNAQGWIVALADMPFIAPDTIHAIANELLREGAITAPLYQGQRGHPVGFPEACGSALLELSGDQGAKSIIETHRASVHWIACQDPGILRDIDTPADLP